MKISHSVLPHILPFFNICLADKVIQKVVHRVSQVLPPLSEWDSVELYTLLPILSVVLSGNLILGGTGQMQKTLIQIAPDLLDYALNKEANAASRSAAVSCIFSIVSKYQDDMNSCMGKNLMKSVLSPHIVKNIQTLSSQEYNALLLNDIVDALNLSAMIASASSQRGGVSVKTADEIARFLTLLSCEGAACSHVLGIENILDYTSEFNNQKIIDISLSSADAFASIFHLKSSSPFTKQRLAHITLPIVLSSNITRDSQLLGIEFGCLSCASHIINCVPSKAFEHDKLSKLSSLLVIGLDKVVRCLVSEVKCGTVQGSLEALTSLLLAAVLKLYNEYPMMVSERRLLSNLTSIINIKFLLHTHV